MPEQTDSPVNDRRNAYDEMADALENFAASLDVANGKLAVALRNRHILMDPDDVANIHGAYGNGMQNAASSRANAHLLRLMGERS